MDMEDISLHRHIRDFHIFTQDIHIREYMQNTR